MSDEDYSISAEFLDAARSDDVAELKRLLAAEKDEILNVDIKDPWTGATALHMAAANGHCNTLKFLLTECQPKPKYTTNSSGNSPLHWALQNGKWEAALMILTCASESVDVLQRNEFGTSVLSEAMNRQPPTEEEAPPMPGTIEALSAEVLSLILEHPTAAALEDVIPTSETDV